MININKNNYFFQLRKTASPDYIIPTTTPKSPNADPKISITKILTNVSAV